MTLKSMTHVQNEWEGIPIREVFSAEFNAN